LALPTTNTKQQQNVYVVYKISVKYQDKWTIYIIIETYNM